MINTSTLKRFAGLSAVALGLLLAAGDLAETSAQRDPFAKPSFLRVRKPAPPSSGKPAKPPAPVVNYGPPPIEARIEYFKRLRETAAAGGTPLPKVTSVLTLNEMAVTGIFKTPRGYAAMVEAMPIKLSYTIYPGEKFFDGQLVAVEENRLVFRRVNKIAEGKFVSSVENKPLKQFTTRAQIEGTAPTQASPTQVGEKPVETASNTAPPPGAPQAKPSSNPFLSPLEEMNRQPAVSPDPEKDKPKKASRKPVKVAKNDN